MYLKKIALGILLFATLNIVSANADEEENFDSDFPCKLFAQTCLNLCLKKGVDITDFSASCDKETSSCKCNEDEITPSVFKNLNELYDDNMELQVEEQNANVTPMKLLNLVLEEDVEYDEYIDEEEDELVQSEDHDNKIFEEILQKELGMDYEEEIEYGEYDIDGNEYVYELVDADEEEVDEDEVDVHEPGSDLVQESKRFCPAFIQRCMDDCPTASSRPSCEIDAKATGYLLVCECNGVDISSSVRSQVMAEVFYAPA